MKTIFGYTPIHSPDDGGWYVEVFNLEGKDYLLDCPISDTREQAIRDTLALVRKALPDARFILVESY